DASDMAYLDKDLPIDANKLAKFLHLRAMREWQRRIKRPLDQFELNDVDDVFLKIDYEMHEVSRLYKHLAWTALHLSVVDRTLALDDTKQVLSQFDADARSQQW